MTHMPSVAVAAEATFGRDGAMFEGLLGFVAQLSLVLWGVVIFTVIIRFVGIRIYRRGGAPAGLVETGVPNAVAPADVVPTMAAVVDLVQAAPGQLPDVRLGSLGSTGAKEDGVAGPATRIEDDLDNPQERDAVTNAAFDEVLHPADARPAVAASVHPQDPAYRRRRAARRSAAHEPALAANSEG
jgi:hypothetical protein